MATVLDVKTNKPRVESVTVKLSAIEAADVLVFIETWYKKIGYGSNQHRSNTIYKSIEAGLAGKTEF